MLVYRGAAVDDLGEPRIVNDCLIISAQGIGARPCLCQVWTLRLCTKG